VRLRKFARLPIDDGGHGRVQGFVGREKRLPPLEIFGGAASRKGRKDVIHGEKDALLGEIDQKGSKIIAAALDLDVVALRDAIDANVKRRSTWHLASDFFTYKEIWMLAKGFGAINRIVVGQSYKGHAATRECVVHSLGIIVGFAAKLVENRYGAHTRVSRVDVHVTYHAPVLNATCYIHVTFRRTLSYAVQRVNWRERGGAALGRVQFHIGVKESNT